MNKLYNLQQATDEKKCAAYAAIYLYLLNKSTVDDQTTNKLIMAINDEVIINTKLAFEVVALMDNVKKGLFTTSGTMNAEDIGGKLYTMLSSNPEITEECYTAIKQYMA